jgi:hypothetical protein
MTNSIKRRHIGSVRQLPNGRWLARISRGTRADGKRRSPSKVFDTKQEAESWLQAMAVQLDERPDLGAGVTLQQLWELYKKLRLPELAKTTQVTYKQRMAHVLEVMGDADISTITHSQAQRMYDTMTPSVAKRTNTVLGAVLTFAVRRGLLDTSPLYKAPFRYGETGRFAAPDSDVWDDDPFAAIEGVRDVWDARTAILCMDRIRGLVLEPIYLACVGAGLRVEEAFALRKMDVRRIVAGYDEVPMEREDGTVSVELVPAMVTQLAVHHATTREESRKATKTVNGSGIVPMLEPFGERLWEIVSELPSRDSPICKLSAARQNKTWRGYFAAPPKQWHNRMSDERKVQGRLHDPMLPYIPLSRMRATHTTIVQQAGVLDSINQSMHRNTGAVQQRHYMRPDTTEAAIKVSRRIR